MRRYSVGGMSCAACSARVEKAVGKVEGVESVSVSLLTNSMNVEGTAPDDAVIKAVVDAGYTASVEGKAKTSSESDDSLRDRETPKLIKRLAVSAVFTLILMYFSMGALMWHWPLPSFFTANHISIAVVEMFLASIVMVINQKFFISGFKGLVHRAPNMDSLVSLGSGVSYMWSLYLLLDACYLMGKGDTTGAMENIHGLYFESSAMILTLITVGKTLEAKSKGRTTDALRSLAKLKSREAVLIVDGKEVVTPIDTVRVGDIFSVKGGEQIPVDGVVIEGTSAVDESSLTGESLPVDKEKGSRVSSGTINQSGYLVCRAEKVGDDTTISQIIRLVEETASSKAPIAKTADRVSGVFVPVVISIAVVTTIIWMLCSHDIGYSLERGITVLVISCPCALGLATPVAIMVGSGVGARNGILFKSASALEELGKVNVVALDKTGTITEGKSRVDEIYSFNDETDEVIRVASALERKSDHPLSVAVMKYAGEKNITPYVSEDTEVVPGKGIRGKVNGMDAYCGNLGFIKDLKLRNTGYLEELRTKTASSGSSLVYVVLGDTLLGLITIADRIKDDSRKAIEMMDMMGLDVVVITGDNENTARNICSGLKVKKIISGVLPSSKAEEVRKLKAYGKVAFVGDGINDSPALTEADVGIAIGSGTDIAIDSSSVVLMKSTLMDAVGAFNLSRSTLRNIYENLFWAFIYNTVGIPLAAGLFIPLFGWELQPMFGALAMSLSSFCVCSNALRLNLCKIYKPTRRKHRTENTTVKEIKSMERKVKVEGMMCPHCEMRVENVLKALDGVSGAKADHVKGEVTLTLSKDVDSTLIKSTIEKEGYTVKGIE